MSADYKTLLVYLHPPGMKNWADMCTWNNLRDGMGRLNLDFDDDVTLIKVCDYLVQEAPEVATRLIVSGLRDMRRLDRARRHARRARNNAAKAAEVMASVLRRKEL